MYLLLFLAPLALASKRARDTGPALKQARRDFQSFSDDTCNPALFKQKATALLGSWDAKEAHHLWHSCMDAGLPFMDGLEVQINFFMESIRRGDDGLLKACLDSQNLTIYQIFVTAYLKVYKLNHISIPTLEPRREHLVQELRSAVEDLTAEDWRNVLLAYFLSPFLGNTKASPKIYEKVTLSEQWRDSKVKLLTLLILFPPEQLLSRLDKHFVFTNLNILALLVDFCQQHGIDMAGWKLSENERDLVMVYSKKEQATGMELGIVFHHLRSSHLLLNQFLAFICRHHPNWGSKLPPSVWADFMNTNPGMAEQVPLPPNIPDITQFIKPEHTNTVNVAIFKAFEKKYGVEAVVNFMMSRYPQDYIKFLYDVTRG